MAGKATPAMPTRGTPGGWDVCREGDEAAAVRAELAERGRRLLERVATRAALATEGDESSRRT